MKDEITLIQPDDWHLHLRDGAAMASVVAHSARQFGRAMVMPNLQPPVTTIAQALAYRTRILAARPEGTNFQPLMTLYLTEDLAPKEIRTAKHRGVVQAAKLYPAGATTHSEQGITRLATLYPVLEAMQEVDLPLLIHGETTDPDTDIFDRERRFLDESLSLLVRDFPGLRVVLEHITTADARDFVRTAPETLAATLTPHHLLYNRNALFAGGLRPHFYCLPVLKREHHRQALLEAATSGDPKFFLGTDSAPHALGAKQSACGCAGIYSAHAALELYAEAFDQAGALDRLEGFASRHGADFYRLPYNTQTIRLRRETWTLPETYAFGAESLRPLRAGETLSWRLVTGRSDV